MSRLECGIELGGAVIARLVAKLCRHLPGRPAVLAQPSRQRMADRIGSAIGGIPCSYRCCGRRRVR
jgi:hypothetical protein